MVDCVHVYLCCLSVCVLTVCLCVAAIYGWPAIKMSPPAPLSSICTIIQSSSAPNGPHRGTVDEERQSHTCSLPNTHTIYTSSTETAGEQQAQYKRHMQ